VRLFEHRNFEQAVIQASEHFGARGLRPALVEKDYYVTEALRIIAPDMSFATGDALFPSGELAGVLGAEHEAQCRQLCLGPYPPWGEARARFETLRTLL
jgi:hypothetical protein